MYVTLFCPCSTWRSSFRSFAAGARRGTFIYRCVHAYMYKYINIYNVYVYTLYIYIYICICI